MLEHAQLKSRDRLTGKHSLTLNKASGSWFFLGELFVNIPLTVDKPVGRIKTALPSDRKPRMPLSNLMWLMEDGVSLTLRLKTKVKYRCNLGAQWGIGSMAVTIVS